MRLIRSEHLVEPYERHQRFTQRDDRRALGAKIDIQGSENEAAAL
jgi:hypothetical protein